ncbi:ABC transporter substrate-binding protein [Microbacterium sp.]|uniref:ABC transporter substrate-binding protein n=1 Tax=Microbacterium sp. TaxID=51671 RepID=UPI003A8F12BD
MIHRRAGAKRRLLFPTMLAVAASVILVGCSSGAGANGTTSTNANAPGKSADTISWALPPATVPNWIWPFSPLADFSVTNSDMQLMLYRSLYWYGDNGKTGVDYSLSLAQKPVFSNGGKTITITMNPYKWSNGESVTAQDVVFWINMDKAEKADYAGYTPGQFPDNIVTATAKDDTTLVLTTDKAYSQEWFLMNQLSQITPMPMAWDMTSATTKGTCATDVSGCAAVYKYLNAQAKDLPSYAKSPVWSVVDGPWMLKSFNSDGHVAFVPNTAYSGPQKAQVKEFDMVPFTTDAAEFNVVRSGKTLDVGYIPTQDIAQPKPASSAPDAAGPNPLSSNYRLMPWFLYGFNYFPINYTNPTVGPIFKQLYFRQALQSIVDQQGVISSTAKNYGVETTGPVPLFPDSPLISNLEKNNPYPFSTTKAAKYLTDNGWKVVAGGVTTCVKPGTAAGDCGAGIAAGTPLTFSLPYASGSSTIDTAMASMKSNAAKVGITLNLKSEPFNTVIGATVPTSKTWEMGNWGGGWVYAPDYYPTGELLFATGAGSNSGAYSNPELDKLIQNSNLESGVEPLQAYEDFMAKNVPVIYQPNYTYSLTEVANGLKGYDHNNPYGSIKPEDWHY